MECTENTERNKESIKMAIKNKIPEMFKQLSEAEKKSSDLKFLEMGDDVKGRAHEAKVIYDEAM